MLLRGQPMTNRDRHSVSGAQPLDAIIAGYLQAVDAGRAPDQSALLAAHPDLADELAAFFADYAKVDKVAAPLRPPDGITEAQTVPPQDTVAEPPRSLPRTFGDYELL